MFICNIIIIHWFPDCLHLPQILEGEGGSPSEMLNSHLFFLKRLQCAPSFPLAWPTVTVHHHCPPVSAMPSILHNKLPTWSCVTPIHAGRLCFLCTFLSHFVQMLELIWNYSLYYFWKETEKHLTTFPFTHEEHALLGEVTLSKVQLVHILFFYN